MDSKIIACLGIDHYDLVQSLAGVAVGLGKTVMVVDLTRDQAMMISIPAADFVGECVNYLGIDFTNSKTYLSQQAKNYDYVFIYFGNDFNTIPSWVEEVYCVTDCQKQNIARFKGLQLQSDQYRNLIIRGNLGNKDYKQYALAELSHLGFNEEAVVELPFSDGDLEAMLAVQYYSKYKVVNMSYELQDFITKFFSVDASEKEIKNAIKKFSKTKGGK